MPTTQYPKRLIEVDLPIKRISAHARREKSIRHGHISTLHIWWARRPLAACRAVICAALWPDPADSLCPEAFVKTAKTLMLNWAKNHPVKASADSLKHLLTINKNPQLLDDPVELRKTLLDFIADFANWDNSTDADYLETSRTLTQTAHEALGGIPGTKPLVVDPFAGGGSIPLEALRVGADAFASDLNPVAVLLNKVVLEYIPKYGQQLADEVRKWGQWVKEEAQKELAEFYPKDPDGATPIAYLWARTITCEGPGCGAEVPLMRSLWLAKKSNRSVALRIIPKPEEKRVDFEIIEKQNGKWVVADKPEVEIKNPSFDGTVKRGFATCPCCSFTTPVASVRRQLKERYGGAADAKLFCIVITKPNQQGRFYRLPNEQDLEITERALDKLKIQKSKHQELFSLVPDEPTPDRLVEVKGDKARLLPVSERTHYLFGKDEAQAPTKRKKKDVKQLSLFDIAGSIEDEDNDWGEKTVPPLGNTVLDRIHQSMILFAAGRSEALKRFLVEEGAGTDQRFWRLAQALSALYPNGTDEKRWVDGVLARKKGLGF